MASGAHPRIVITGEQLADRPSMGPVPWSVVFPIRRWIDARPWGSTWGVLLLLGVLAPLIFVGTVSPSENPTSELHRVSAFFGIYFAVGWLLILRFVIRPERVGWQLPAAVAALTALVGAPLAGALEQGLLGDGTPDLISFILVVGLVEETVKWGVVYLLVYRPGHQLTPLTYMYFGVIAGLAFGVAEAINYSVLYAHSLDAIGIAGIGAYTAAALVRLTVLPLLHACMTGISCFFLGLAAWQRSHRVPLMLTGLGLAILLHGLYDGLHSSWVVAGLIVLLFIAYIAGGESIEAELRKLEEGGGRVAEKGPLVVLRPRYGADGPAGALEPVSVRIRRRED
jgi:RsiW-degrading membrane proteinase PrsW (M82 family)